MGSVVTSTTFHACPHIRCKSTGRQAAPVSQTQIATYLQKTWVGRKRNNIRTERTDYIDHENALIMKSTSPEDARLYTDMTCKMFIRVLLPPETMTCTAAACGWRGPAPGLLGGTGPLPATSCQKEPPRRSASCSACTALLP